MNSISCPSVHFYLFQKAFWSIKQFYRYKTLNIIKHYSHLCCFVTSSQWCMFKQSSFTFPSKFWEGNLNSDMKKKMARYKIGIVRWQNFQCDLMHSGTSYIATLMTTNNRPFCLQIVAEISLMWSHIKVGFFPFILTRVDLN